MNGGGYMTKSKVKKITKPKEQLRVKTGSVKDFFANVKKVMRAADKEIGRAHV